MAKFIKVESAKADMGWVKVDTKFMDSLPAKFGHLTCNRCGDHKMVIGVFPNESIKVGCSTCSWEFEIPFEYHGKASLILPV